MVNSTSQAIVTLANALGELKKNVSAIVGPTVKTWVDFTHDNATVFVEWIDTATTTHEMSRMFDVTALQAANLDIAAFGFESFVDEARRWVADR